MPVELECENPSCENTFSVPPSHAEDRSHCSRECHQEVRRRRSEVEVECDRDGCDNLIEEKRGNLEWRRREYDGVYCSGECRAVASRTGKMLTCENCDEEFYQPGWKLESEDHGNRFCDAECRYDTETETHEVKTTVCDHCGEEFSYRTGRSSGRFCSLDCYHMALRPDGVENKPTKKCERCGEEFEIPPSKIQEYRYCSEDCRRGIVRLFGEPIMRECGRCGKVKSLTDFPEQHDRERGKTYRLGVCDQCRVERQRKRYHSNEEGGYTSECRNCGREFSHYVPDRKFCSRDCSDRRNRPENGKKWCNGCGRRLSVKQFSDRNGHADGLSSRCKRCEAIQQHRRSNLPGDFKFSDIQNQWYRQNGKCFWCGKRCGDNPNDEEYHIDHLTPVARLDAGPTNFPRNLVISCPECNYAKSNRLPIEFKLYRLKNGESQKTYAHGTEICP